MELEETNHWVDDIKTKTETELRILVFNKQFNSILLSLWIGLVIWVGNKATEVSPFGYAVFLLLILPIFALLRSILVICIAEEELDSKG